MLGNDSGRQCILRRRKSFADASNFPLNAIWRYQPALVKNEIWLLTVFYRGSVKERFGDARRRRRMRTSISSAGIWVSSTNLSWWIIRLSLHIIVLYLFRWTGWAISTNLLHFSKFLHFIADPGGTKNDRHPSCQKLARPLNSWQGCELMWTCMGLSGAGTQRISGNKQHWLFFRNQDIVSLYCYSTKHWDFYSFTVQWEKNIELPQGRMCNIKLLRCSN